MKEKMEIHIPEVLSDNRQNSSGISSLLTKFASKVTTIRFQISLILILGLTDYFTILVNGVSDKFPQFLVFFIIDAGFFFTYVHFIFPKLATRSKLITILSTLLFSLSIHTLLHITVYCFFAKNPYQFISTLGLQFVINPLYRAWQRMIISLFQWSAYEIKNAAKREQILENNILHSRISPHLLFNALNMLPVETSVPLKNDRIIELLSGYTRNAMIELGNDGKGQLVNELEQLEILLQINELRFGKLYIQLHKELPADLSAYRIPPQIIVSLAENIFKYGIVDDPNKPVIITIIVSKGYLTAALTNHKYPVQEHSSTKIGINSVKKRLAIIYEKNHHLKISETLEVFSIEIGFPV